MRNLMKRVSTVLTMFLCLNAYAIEAENKSIKEEPITIVSESGEILQVLNEKQVGDTGWAIPTAGFTVAGIGAVVGLQILGTIPIWLSEKAILAAATLGALGTTKVVLITTAIGATVAAVLIPIDEFANDGKGRKYVLRKIEEKTGVDIANIFESDRDSGKDISYNALRRRKNTRKQSSVIPEGV